MVEVVGRDGDVRWRVYIRFDAGEGSDT